MAGSYDRRRLLVRFMPDHGRAAIGWLIVLGLAPAPSTSAATPGAQQTEDTTTVTLQLRVFDGADDVTKDTRLMLYPRGKRTDAIPVTLGPDQAYEATVATGFYDVQTIRERRGQVVGIRWVEQVLVQRYPDEGDRNLHVLNLNATYGALQIRPAQSDAAAAKGWSAVVYQTGNATREVGKAQPIGEDLLVVVPAGVYDIRVQLADRSTTWLREVEIPVDRTRLKTWSTAAPSQ